MLRFFITLSLSLFMCLLCPYYAKGKGLEETPPTSLRIKKKAKKHIWKQYGTFDEFKLKGIGTPGDSSVYVKDDGDSILVRKSSNMDSVIIYRKNGDYWENHIFLEFERDNLEYMVKSTFDMPPRIYDRYLIGDTLVEIHSFFYPKLAYAFFYLIIKPSSYDRVYRIYINPRDPKYCGMASLLCLIHYPYLLNNMTLVGYFRKNPKRILELLNNPTFEEADIKIKVTEYLVSEDAEYIYYSNDYDDTLIAKKSPNKNPYGIFGLQPGFEHFYLRSWTPWWNSYENNEIEHVDEEDFLVRPPEQQDR